MKLKDGDRVYIQNMDALFMLREIDDIPICVVDELLCAERMAFAENKAEPYKFEVFFPET